MRKIPELISLHGGHSSRYCTHAADLLEDMILRYIELGFTKVGITEHVPPVSDQFLYPDEKELNLTSVKLLKRFENYFKELDRLKKKYAPEIRIFAGMETETCEGYVDHIKKLISRFQPDYIVGSVHHIGDISFDFSRAEYDRAVLTCGSIEAMYEKYFDLQYNMIKALKPFVVGHFDLVRIHDKDYKQRLLLPKIQKKIIRNLTLIKSLNLVMDFNLRPLARGEEEPYITPSILEHVKKLGIPVVPGDDSHSVHQAGLNVARAIDILKAAGFSTQWPDPMLLT